MGGLDRNLTSVLVIDAAGIVFSTESGPGDVEYNVRLVSIHIVPPVARGGMRGYNETRSHRHGGNRILGRYMS